MFKPVRKKITVLIPESLNVNRMNVSIATGMASSDWSVTVR